MNPKVRHAIDRFVLSVEDDDGELSIMYGCDGMAFPLSVGRYPEELSDLTLAEWALVADEQIKLWQRFKAERTAPTAEPRPSPTQT